MYKYQPNNPYFHDNVESVGTYFMSNASNQKESTPRPKQTLLKGIGRFHPKIVFPLILFHFQKFSP